MTRRSRILLVVGLLLILAIIGWAYIASGFARFEKLIDTHEKLLIVLSTIAIAGFTGTLWYSTSRLQSLAAKQSRDTEEALRISRLTADAAMLQAKAAVATELPMIALAGCKLVAFDDLDRPTVDPVPGGMLPPQRCRAVVDFKNVGRTPAYVLHYSIRWEVTKELTPEPHYGRMATTNSIIGPDRVQPIMHDRDWITLTVYQQDAMGDRMEHLWLYGFLTYGDFLSNTHDIGFCFRWEVWPEVGPEPRGFVQDGPASYRYHKRQESA
jgi:hypothetical protein